jgi:hypothetical protein
MPKKEASVQNQTSVPAKGVIGQPHTPFPLQTTNGNPHPDSVVVISIHSELASEK